MDRSALPGTGRVASSPLPTTPADNRTPAEVRKLLAEADSIWSRSDAGALANLFAEDASLVSTSARWFQSRTKIQEHLTDLFAHGFQGTSSRTTVLTSTSLGPDLTVLEVRWELRVSPTQSDPPLTIAGLRVVSRANRHWLVAAAQETITRPFPPQNA